jgi:hypothetical protein
MTNYMGIGLKDATLGGKTRNDLINEAWSFGLWALRDYLDGLASAGKDPEEMVEGRKMCGGEGRSGRNLKEIPRVHRAHRLSLRRVPCTTR